MNKSRGRQPNYGTSAFVNPTGIISKIPLKSNSGFANLATGAMITYDAYQRLPGDVKSQFVNLTKNALSNLGKGNNNNNNRIKGNKMNGKINKGSSIVRFKGGSAESADAGTFYLSKAVNPSQISLNTGITPNTYVSDYMDAVTSSCSPLHLSSGIVKIPTTNTWDLYKYWTQIVSYDIQSKAQANVGFSLNITSSFNSAQILTAFNALINALQLYFYYASIISYHDNPANKNMGMIYLRNGMTIDIFNDMALLGRRLADTPCPPNLLSLLKYLSGNFLTGPNPMSPMIKLVPYAITATGQVEPTLINAALDALNADATNEVFALLRRAVPQWVPGKLSDVPSVPVYDENFKTIFANLPFRLYNDNLSTSTGYPYITNGDPIQYNSFSNNLDGAAFALTGYYSVNDDDIYGLISPFNSNSQPYGSSRRSFYTTDNGTTYSFVRVESSEYLSRCRPETYQAKGSGVEIKDPIHLPGASKCLGVRIDSIKETSFKLMDWMMSLDTIKNNNLLKKTILNT